MMVKRSPHLFLFNNIFTAKDELLVNRDWFEQVARDHVEVFPVEDWTTADTRSQRRHGDLLGEAGEVLI